MLVLFIIRPINSRLRAIQNSFQKTFLMLEYYYPLFNSLNDSMITVMYSVEAARRTVDPEVGVQFPAYDLQSSIINGGLKNE